MSRKRGSRAGWIKIHNAFYDCPKGAEAGAHGALLWLVSIAWADRNRTDGFVGERQVPALAAPYRLPRPRQLAERLVEVGLWERENGGYRVHDYLDWQESAAEIEERQEQERERGRERRRRQLERK